LFQIFISYLLINNFGYSGSSYSLIITFVINSLAIAIYIRYSKARINITLNKKLLNFIPVYLKYGLSGALMIAL